VELGKIFYWPQSLQHQPLSLRDNRQTTLSRFHLLAVSTRQLRSPAPEVQHYQHAPPLIIPSPKDDYRLLYLLAELLALSLLNSLLSWRRVCARRVYWLALFVFLSNGVMISGCGGGSSGVGGNQGTPAGTYPLVVSGTFTSGSTKLAHNANLTLVVQ
jgi:hypothetical protein